MMQNYPLSIFHASVWPESLPGADLSTFSRFFFCYFGAYLGPLGPKKASIVGIVKLSKYCLVAEEEDFLLAQEEDLLLAQEEHSFLGQEEDLLLGQEEDLLLAQEKDFHPAQEKDLLLV